MTVIFLSLRSVSMMSGLIHEIHRQLGTRDPAWDVPEEEAPKLPTTHPDKRWVVLKSRFAPSRSFCSRNGGSYRSDLYLEVGCYDFLWQAQEACGVPSEHLVEDRTV